MITTNLKYLLLFIISTFSRWPYLSYGYGSEDDSWGLVLNARLMNETGQYSFSRLPGHPFQEFVFAMMPNAGPFSFNLLSALFSAIAVVALADSLHRLRISHWMPWSVIFSLVPIFFISGTYTIDYAWALSFILLSWNCLLRSKWVLCGFLLGLAIACRITSGAVLFGFILMLYSSKEKPPISAMIKLTLAGLLTGVIWYIPSYLTYGLAFFNTYSLPYPSIPKVITKLSVGVWGVTGSLGIIWLVLRLKKSSINLIPIHIRNGLLLIIFLFTFAFLILPQKSAFLLPIVPFVITLFAGLKLSRGELLLVGFLFIVSPMTFGINLSDPERGSDYSSSAILMNVSGQQVFFDPFTGPIQIERSRRINRQKYVNKSYINYAKTKTKSALLCGWWMNQFSEKVFQAGANNNVVIIEYANENQLDSLLKLDYKLLHLDEIDVANDNRFDIRMTQKLSKEL